MGLSHRYSKPYDNFVAAKSYIGPVSRFLARPYVGDPKLDRESADWLGPSHLQRRMSRCDATRVHLNG
ncbi:MAG: hypothetical protein JWM82_1838 [Myxococcales bacterium]|nr:hypothetical protein [Myxococcales bacterium]